MLQYSESSLRLLPSGLNHFRIERENILEDIYGKENEGVSRRDVLKTAATGAGVLAALPILTSAVRADDPQAPPSPPAKPAEDWKPAGDAAQFKQNQPVRVDLGITVAWV